MPAPDGDLPAAREARRSAVVAEQAQALADAPLFAGLPPHLLRPLAERAVPRELSRGTVLFQRDEPGDAVYLVRRGLLKVYDSSPDGTELLLTVVPPGATVGELALADGGRRSASVAALRPSSVLALRRPDFLAALRADGALAEPLLRHLAGRLRQVTDLAADLVFLDLSTRIVKLLLRLADDTGRPLRPGLRLTGLTQSDLAAMAGSSRQSTNKVLRGLVQDGLIELDGRDLCLLRPDLLRARGVPLT